MKKFTTFAMALLCVAAVSCKKSDLPDNGKDKEEPVKEAAFSTITLSPSSADMALSALAGSPNGKYAAGSNFMSGQPAIWDIEANTVSEIANLQGETFAVTNNGTIVGQGRDINAGEESYNNYAFMASGTSGKNLYFDPSVTEIVDEYWGESYTVPVEDGSAAYAINEKEDLIAGFYFAGYSPLPCIWKAPFTGAADRITLPVPSSEVLGFNVDGGEVRWMSADASVLCGFVVDDTASWPLVIWNRQADGSYVCDPICSAYFHPFEWESETPVTAPYMMFHPCGISANGEWVALTVQAYSEEFDVPTKAARFNLKTKELVVCENGDFEPGSISNDGTLVGSTLQSFWDPKPIHSYVWKAGERSAIDVVDMVGAEAFANFAETKMCYIAPNNSYAVGYGVDNDFNTTSFIIK